MQDRHRGHGLAMRLILLTGVILLTGCSLFTPAPPPVQTLPVPSGNNAPAQPRLDENGLSRYGNPEFYDVMGRRYFPLKSARGFKERGIASWYGPDFHGKLTSTRETYDMHQMTGAHKLLPLPTWVEVTNLANGRRVTLRINDRGPFVDDRIIDLSYAAAQALGVVGPGTAEVEVRAIDPPANAPSPALLAGPVAATWLQVGAFGQRENAERLRARLDPVFGEQVKVFVETPEDPRIYKVQLGPIRDAAHADTTVLTLQQLGISQHHFVNN